jgi:malonate decarboxylase alpha subunit
MNRWDSQPRGRRQRLERAASVARGKQVDAAAAAALLETVIEPGDRVCLEGNNQKQADFLAKTLASLDPGKIHSLHMVQSVLALPEHLELFERGLAKRLDFSFSGPQGARLARLVQDSRIEIGAIHT